MVVRLFVPPAEGQHHVVPRRPDPLAANATLYVIVAATVAAAGQAFVAARFARRTAPHTHVSRTALFVTSSARLGVWAAATGAVVNSYYHKNFTTVVVTEAGNDPTPGRLWERTEAYTAEDGCIAGAALGMAAFLPTLYMRQASVPWWTRLLGMATIGASTGIVASQAYFQYTGERGKALDELNRQRRRRALEFHTIFWNKLLMARFDPLIQQYVRHNGVFRAYHIPAEVYEAPEQYGFASSVLAKKSATTPVLATSPETDDRFYTSYQAFDDYLKILDVERTQRENEGYRQERQSLLKEAEYLYYELTKKQYLLCNTVHSNEDDRQQQLREIEVTTFLYNRLHIRAEELRRGIHFNNVWMQQKAALDSHDARTAWLSSTTMFDPDSHDPKISIREMKALGDRFASDVKHWEGLCHSQASEAVARREKYMRDLDDARALLRAADQMVYEMERNAQDVAKRVINIDEPPEKLEPEKSK